MAQAPTAPCVADVGVVAGDQHAGKRDTEFRSDDVHDPLPLVVHVDVRQPELGGVVRLHPDHVADFGVGDPLDACRPIDRRQVVVGDGELLLRPMRLAPLEPELIEGQEGLPFIDVVEIDVKQLFALR